MRGEARSVAAGSPTRRFLRALFVAVAFGVVTLLGLLFVAPPDNVSYFWPASGFLVALLALTPKERWLTLLLLLFPTDVLLGLLGTGRGLLLNIGLSLADMLGAVSAAWLLLRVGGPRPDLRSVRQVVALVLIAAPTGAVLSALAGALIVSKGGTTGSLVHIFGTWAASVVISDTVVTPLLVAWAGEDREVGKLEIAESIAVAGVVALVTFYVFATTGPGLPLLYLPFPFVFLAALRLGPRGASLASFVVAMIAFWLAVRGISPLVLVESKALRVQWMQLMIGTMAVSSLALGAAITEQRTTAGRLHRAEARFRLVVEDAPVAIVLTGKDGVISFANPAFGAILARPLSEIIGHRFAEFTHPDDVPENLGILRELVEGKRERVSFEKRYLRLDGTVVETLLHIAVLRDESEAFASTITMVEDISQRKHLERQLLQSQKVEAVGRLAGGVAHDFNNLLTVILAQSSIGAHGARDPTVREALRDINDAAVRGAALTKQLLAFARKQVIEPKLVEVDAFVQSLMNLLRRVIAEVDVRFTPRASGWLVRMDPSQLEQVVVNLAVNARDAMPDGGVFSIVTAHRTIQTRADGEDGVEPGDWVLLTLQDTGTGMSDAVQQHLFEPFFTTKERGKGTGLGLATVHGNVVQAGGHIGVSSAKGRGTTFRIWLPRATGVPKSAAEPSGDSPSRGETVLVVEDEPAVRRVAVETLRAHGYDVLEAASAEAALQVARAHPRAIDVLLTDVIMPGKNGRALADELLRERPSTLVIFTSGYTDQHIERHGILDDGVAFLPKPYTPTELRAKVHDALRAHAAPAANARA